MDDETPHTNVATNTSSFLGRTSGFPGGGGGGGGRADNVVPSGWSPPTRFDPDDRSTWPEDGQRVLVLGDGWELVTARPDEFARDREILWLPLPPTPQEGS